MTNYHPYSSLHNAFYPDVVEQGILQYKIVNIDVTNISHMARQYAHTSISILHASHIIKYG